MKKTILMLTTIISISSCAYVGFGIGLPINGNAKIMEKIRTINIENIKELKKNN